MAGPWVGCISASPRKFIFIIIIKKKIPNLTSDILSQNAQRYDQGINILKIQI